MYIQTGQVFKWRQRKRKGNIVSILNRYLVMMPLVLISTAGIALAEPTGGVITGGSGTITQAESATNISQASPRLDINWQTFSTEVHESVNFTQPTADALAINRVIGGVPSELRGALNANGRVVILNDSGITFFGTSQVNVGALLATTATNLSTDGDRLSFSGAGYGTVLNQGYIHVSDGGFAVLAAPYVSNTGFIQANLGTIQLASANDFTVDFRGDGLIGFTVSKSTLDGIAEAGKPLGVDNTGTLLAGSGTIGISAAAASSIVQSVVNLDGVADASSFGAGTDGGTVLVTSVGDINIGGEVHADGGASGNGGTVTTWADGMNFFGPGAVITARGGEVSGNGGFIEVSGNDVRVRGTANASAPNGAAGTFLIDPAFALTIADGAGTDSTATVFEQNIEATSVGGTNVSLVADNSITMEDLTTDGVLQGGNGAISMSVNPVCSDCAITFADPTDKIATTGGAITMTAPDGTAGEGGLGLGTINIGHLETLHNNANITLTAGLGGITTGNLCAGGGDVCGEPAVNNPGDITLTTTGDITTGNATIFAELFDSASAFLNMDAGGNLTVGNISLTAIDPNDNATAIANLSAGGSVTAGNVSVTAEGEKNVTAAFNVDADGDINLGVRLPDPEFYGILVSATALDGGSDSAVADAAVSLNGQDVLIDGDIKVIADATNNTDSYATANAVLAINATNAEGDTGDIEVTGSTVVAASAAFGASNLSASTASAYASADLSAGGDLNLWGVTVDANADGSLAPNARDANAEANLNASVGHDIITTGTTVVTAEASLATSGTNDAYAYANASFSANNNISLTGASPAVTVQATATNTGLGGTASADDDANASLSIYASNDVTVNGDILVSALSTLDGSALDSAAADADADIYGNNIIVNGNITVEASATNSAAPPVEASCYYYCGSGAEASADLYMSTGGEGGGDITINGATVVTASATVEGEATGSASASAYADISADNNVIVNGDITVEATALNNSVNGSGASASADLYVGANNDLTITGNTLVSATAEMAAGTDSASASATADLWAGNNVTVTGDIKVEANALTGVSDASSASASAELYVEAGSDLTITGDVTVSAKAMGAATESASASASADLYAGGDLTVNGDITVEAIAENTSGSDATADADLYMEAYEGDVNITGDILVKAEATLGAAGTDSASASASAEIYGYDVNITGDVTVTAIAVNNGTEASDATASADLYIGANNDLTITGNTLVTADATAAGSYGSAYASAYADISANNNVTVNGDLTVNADAVNTAGSASSVSAYATLLAIASSGDLNITGDIDVTAGATHGEGYYSAEAVAVALLTGGNDVNITTGSGTINVAANAVNSGSGSAAAGAALVAAAGVDGNQLIGLAEEIANGYVDPTNPDVFSELFGSGDLNITGDIMVTAKADAASGDAMAVAAAIMAAANDATILTDPITVRSEANAGAGYGSPDGYPYYSYGGGADASSFLVCAAGVADGEGGASGNLYITGDVSATAIATGTSYDSFYYGGSSGFAFTGLFAADDLTVLGADPLAYAPTTPGADHARVQGKESATDPADTIDGCEGGFCAALVIDAGGTVLIEPKPVVAAPQPVEDNEHEVVSALETKEIRLIEPLGPGKDPLSFDADGLASWATGAGVTAPSQGSTLTPDLEEAIARGVDPTTILPAPAAGGMGLSSGLDAYSVGGPDFCDQVVSGYCLPQEGKKKTE